ncbi:sugar kinase [Humidisolicoccus flavus]|uniref:sugar kinase n=1 Tax=Humidisolicoccus flavus TaxID=3111414 RepID=UPI0032478BBF
MTTAFDVLTIGETMVLVTPEPGAHLAQGERCVLGTAGAESNVAIGLQKLGARAAWHSRLGEGTLGDLVQNEIADAGVAVGSVVRDGGAPTGTMFKQQRPEGSTEVIYYRKGSAAAGLSIEDLPLLPTATIIHLSGVTAAISESALGLSRALLARSTHESLVSFDVNYRPVLWENREAAAAELLSLARAADIVFVGRDEAESLWGTATAAEIRALLPDVAHLIVKDADIAAHEFSGDTSTEVPANSITVVDPVGAGDAFAAGWLASHLAGLSAEQRLHHGHRLASLVLQSVTDQTSEHVEPILRTAASAKDSQ